MLHGTSEESLWEENATYPETGRCFPQVEPHLEEPAVFFAASESVRHVCGNFLLQPGEIRVEPLSHMLRLQRTNTIHPRTSTIQTFYPSLTRSRMSKYQALKGFNDNGPFLDHLGRETETRATNQVQRGIESVYVHLKWP